MHDQKTKKKMLENFLLDLESEPIFGIRIEFCDESQPIEMLNLNLISATKVLQEWSEKWILVPDKHSKLNDAVWKWNARPRNVEVKNITLKDPDIETYADILDPNYIPEVVREEDVNECH